MHYQLLAYSIVESAHVQLTKATARDTGYDWAHLILEMRPIPSELDWEDPADAAWWLGQLLQEWALNRRPAPPSTSVPVDQ